MLSYVRGTKSVLREQTVDEALKEAASRWANHAALVVLQHGKRLTFSELDAEVGRVAAGIAALGLRAEDRVGVWATSCAEWILVQLGCARAGV
ncbi:MAG: AMP-binding protein, partial [Candidatus Sulfotelmatobacter sp.]